MRPRSQEKVTSGYSVGMKRVGTSKRIRIGYPYSQFTRQPSRLVMPLSSTSINRKPTQAFQ